MHLHARACPQHSNGQYTSFIMQSFVNNEHYLNVLIA